MPKKGDIIYQHWIRNWTQKSRNKTQVLKPMKTHHFGLPVLEQRLQLFFQEM